MWLDATRHHSTLDWFDRDFVLVAGPLGHAWKEAAAAASRAARRDRRLPPASPAIPADGFQMGMRGAALVRPDGHVCYRAAWMPEDPGAELSSALHRVLPGVDGMDDTTELAPQIAGIHHFTIRCTPAELDAVRDFYRDVLGMRAGPRPAFDFPGYWMYVGDVAMVHLVALAAVTDGGSSQPRQWLRPCVAARPGAAGDAGID